MQRNVKNIEDECYDNVREIVNLTPQEITVYQENGQQIKIQPSGMMARVHIRRDQSTLKGYIHGKVKIIEYQGNRAVPVETFEADIPVMKPTFEAVTGIPPEKEGTVYLVSSMVAMAVPERKDVVSPDTLPGGSLKGFGGVMGIKALQTWYDPKVNE